MEIKIEKKVEQPLLMRDQLQGTIYFENATPSRAEIRKKLAESMKANESTITIQSIGTSFGKRSCSLIAHVYKSKEALERYESKTTIRRHLSKEERAKLKEKKVPEAGAQ